MVVRRRRLQPAAVTRRGRSATGSRPGARRSGAFAGSPPDVVRYGGTPVSVWRSDNGWIRGQPLAVAGAYFCALTELPYLIAGWRAYGYDRDELAAAVTMTAARSTAWTRRTG